MSEGSGALEDNRRRLQERPGKVLTGEAPHNFQIFLAWPHLNERGAARLEQWLQSHPKARLVVIDTLAKFRKPSNGNNVYVEDYGALESLIIGRISSIKHPLPHLGKIHPWPLHRSD